MRAQCRFPPSLRLAHTAAAAHPLARLARPGVEGGFDVDKPQFEYDHAYQIAILPEDTYLPLSSPELPANVRGRRRVVSPSVPRRPSRLISSSVTRPFPGAGCRGRHHRSRCGVVQARGGLVQWVGEIKESGPCVCRASAVRLPSSASWLTPFVQAAAWEEKRMVSKYVGSRPVRCALVSSLPQCR